MLVNLESILELIFEIKSYTGFENFRDLEKLIRVTAPVLTSDMGG